MVAGLYFGPMTGDPTLILAIIGVVLTLFASAKVQSTFSKYCKVRSRSGYTGAEVAERILRNAGIRDVRVERVRGNLTDHYDPRKKALRLSESVYGETSVAAISVAAHECGHAVQDNESYAPLVFRNTLVPVASFGSNIGLWIAIAGLIFVGPDTGLGSMLLTFGIILFSAAVLFQIVTLPVEFNASSRALKILENSGVLYQEELGKARKVLNAAALTYVAAAAASVLTLLRWIMIARRGRGGD